MLLIVEMAEMSFRAQVPMPLEAIPCSICVSIYDTAGALQLRRHQAAAEYRWPIVDVPWRRQRQGGV